MAQQDNLEAEYAFSASVKAMNYNLGPEGLVPSPLVFSESPQVHNRSEARKQRAFEAGRVKIANAARLKMQKHMSLLRVRRALNDKSPAAAEMSHKVGDKVLVRREKVVDR